MKLSMKANMRIFRVCCKVHAFAKNWFDRTGSHFALKLACIAFDVGMTRSCIALRQMDEKRAA